MKSTEMLNQIKTLLNIEVKLEEQKLENGTLVEAESFEKGKEIFIKTDDQKVAMPVGEYILEDGRLLVVQEEGIIGDVREVSDEAPAKEDEEISEDLEEEEEKEMAEVGDWDGLEKRIQNLEDAVADLKRDKVEASDDENTLKSRTVKEEFSEIAAQPIKHNPETKAPINKGFKIAGNRMPTVLDRVLSRLNNN